MIYITGDTHGCFDHIERFCHRMETTENDLMIILGDAGINYDESWHDQQVKQQLVSLPITFFCLHGNHEIRPQHIASYHEREYHGGRVMVEDAYPNILFAVDGEVYEFAGKQCIVIGGAYSVDKYYRLARGLGWWEDEQPSGDVKMAVENRLCSLNWRVDAVLSHTCPLKYEPTEVFLTGIDQSDVDKSTEEWLGAIEERLQYQKWYCGHYHTAKRIDRLQFMFSDIDEFHVEVPKKKAVSLKAHLYLESKLHYNRKTMEAKRDSHGYLFSGGVYPTKIRPSDLPEYYVHGYMYHQYGYISAKGVKHLIYKPNYLFDDHLFKDDNLFISYDSPIVPDHSSKELAWYTGYDEVLSGPIIAKFVAAVGRFSDYDVSAIIAELQRKEDWYSAHNQK